MSVNILVVLPNIRVTPVKNNSPPDMFADVFVMPNLRQRNEPVYLSTTSKDKSPISHSTAAFVTTISPLYRSLSQNVAARFRRRPQASVHNKD